MWNDAHFRNDVTTQQNMWVIRKKLRSYFALTKSDRVKVR